MGRHPVFYAEFCCENGSLFSYFLRVCFIMKISKPRCWISYARPSHAGLRTSQNLCRTEKKITSDDKRDTPCLKCTVYPFLRVNLSILSNFNNIFPAIFKMLEVYADFVCSFHLELIHGLAGIGIHNTVALRHFVYLLICLLGIAVIFLPRADFIFC